MKEESATAFFEKKEEEKVNNFTEKRSNPRTLLRTPLRYQLRGTQVVSSSICEDISLGGTCFTETKYLPPNTRINMEINIFSRMLSSIGKICRSQPLPHSNRYKVGVEFIEMSQEDKKYLEGYITNRVKSAL